MPKNARLIRNLDWFMFFTSLFFSSSAGGTLTLTPTGYAMTPNSSRHLAAAQQHRERFLILLTISRLTGKRLTACPPQIA
jgi:hypothetical protein